MDARPSRPTTGRSALHQLSDGGAVRAVGRAGPACRMAGRPNGRTAAFYLHVPFCGQLCFYCACHTTAMNRQDTLEGYARALLRELELSPAAPDVMVTRCNGAAARPPSWGGRLLKVGRRLAALFDACSAREMSMEVDPRFCDPRWSTPWWRLGVTRASLGVQDFDLAVQRAINRLQSPDSRRPRSSDCGRRAFATSISTWSTACRGKRWKRCRARSIRRSRCSPTALRCSAMRTFLG